MQTELMTASVDDNATAHMLDEQGVELTHANCISMLDKARKYWDTPHKKFQDDYLFAHRLS